MADVACGTGELVVRLAKRFPNSHFVGFDKAEKGIEIGKKLATDAGTSNAEHILANAGDLPSEWTKKFDWIMASDCIHDMCNPNEALAEIRRSLTDDGLFTMIDICVHSAHSDNVGSPMAALIYNISMYCCLASSLSDAPMAGLGAAWGVEAAQVALQSHGFKIKMKEPMKSDDFLTMLYVCGKENEK